MKILQSGWVICLIGCATYLGCTLAFINPKKIAPVQAKEHGDPGEHLHQIAEHRRPDLPAIGEPALKRRRCECQRARCSQRVRCSGS